MGLFSALGRVLRGSGGARGPGFEDSLPWFGGPPFDVAAKGRVPARAVENLPFVRRVLVAWLGGRPVSAMAERAGCSPRLIHEIVREVIYVESARMGLLRWFELGLVAVPALADRRPSEPARGKRRGPPPEPTLPVFCLVCHRQIGLYSLAINKLDGRLLRAEELRWDDRDGWLGAEIAPRIQAHLIGHFKLRHDPIRPSPDDPFDEFRAALGAPAVAAAAERRIKIREVMRRRLRWRDQIDHDVARKVSATRLAPIRNGKVVPQPEAEANWRRLLDNR